MNYQNTRAYIVFAMVSSLFVGIILNVIGTLFTNWVITLIGAILTILGSLLILVWIVNYLHELDARLTEQEKRQ